MRKPQAQVRFTVETVNHVRNLMSTDYIYESAKTLNDLPAFMFPPPPSDNTNIQGTDQVKILRTTV